MAARSHWGCDLLKNIYLCGSNNNRTPVGTREQHVVICLKISIFVVATTTLLHKRLADFSCDLLKNIYLCGSNNNLTHPCIVRYSVVICLKISIFVVATTTHVNTKDDLPSCDLLKNIYLCGSNNNDTSIFSKKLPVVICLKISIFVVATTTFICC